MYTWHVRFDPPPAQSPYSEGQLIELRSALEAAGLRGTSDPLKFVYRGQVGTARLVADLAARVAAESDLVSWVTVDGPRP